MLQKKKVMEFKIQLSNDNGKTWFDSHNQSSIGSYQSVKDLCDLCRMVNIAVKYRIVGRESLPWCEIKE